MGGLIYLRQSLVVAERKRDDARYRYKSLLSNIDEAKGVVRESRDRECNAWPKSLIWIGY